MEEGFDDPFESRPTKCGLCTWRSEEGRCLHGTGPRSSERVDYEMLTCQYGKCTFLFSDGTEDPDVKERRLNKTWGALKDGLLREIKRKSKVPPPRGGKPTLKVVK